MGNLERDLDVQSEWLRGYSGETFGRIMRVVKRDLWIER